MLDVTAEVASSSLVVPAISFHHLQALVPTDQGVLGDDKRQTRIPHSELAAERHLLDQNRFGQQTRRQDGIDQPVLCETLGFDVVCRYLFVTWRLLCRK